MFSLENILDKVKSFQSVPTVEQVLQWHPDWSKETDAESIKESRIRAGAYSCEDKWQIGKIQDNRIYISTNPFQHDVIVKVSSERATQGLVNTNSGDKTAKDLGLGFFSDQLTVDACKTGNGIDNGKYNDACQIAPFNDTQHGEYNYKPHLDCFEIDRDRLEKIYGSRDFFAAIGKCKVNDVCGSGGGNQGYNPYIGEMIDSGCLLHKPEESYSRESSDKFKVTNPNQKILINNTVSRDDYEEINKAARERGNDCVQHDTIHPSSECCEQTKLFEQNDAFIEENTGNAEIFDLEEVHQPEKIEAVVVDVVKTIEEEAPPNLHDLNSFLIEASEKLGITAAEVADCLQHIYEEGDATYPRTDSNCITSDMENTVASILSDTGNNS